MSKDNTAPDMPWPVIEDHEEPITGMAEQYIMYKGLFCLVPIGEARALLELLNLAVMSSDYEVGKLARSIDKELFIRGDK